MNVARLPDISEADEAEKSLAMQRAPRPELTLRKKVMFSALVCLFALGITEIGFRILETIAPPTEVDFDLGFAENARVFQPTPDRPAQLQTAPAKLVSFVEQQFLKKKPARTFRIAALGGSSVHYLQPEFETLRDNLQEQFSDRFDKIEIINCGGFAYGSHRLVILFQELVQYDLDLLLLYTGHNEFEEVEQLQLSGQENAQFNRYVSRSAMIRFLRDRRVQYRVERLRREHNQRVLSSREPVSDSNFARAWSHPFTLADVEQRMVYFDQNLRQILSLAEANEIPMIIGTVASNLLQPYLPQHAARRYPAVYQLWKQGETDAGIQLANQILVETQGRHQSSQLENNIIRNLATEFQLPLVDVVALVSEAEPHGIPGETLFDDHCHLNAKGREVWIDGYRPEIVRIMNAFHQEKSSLISNGRDQPSPTPSPASQ